MWVVHQNTHCGMLEIYFAIISYAQIHFQLTLSMTQSSKPMEITAPTTKDVPIRSVQWVGMSNTVTWRQNCRH